MGTMMIVAFTDSLGRVGLAIRRASWRFWMAVGSFDSGPSDGLRVGTIEAIYGRGSEIWIGGGELGLEQFDHGRFHNIAAVDDELLRGISGIVGNGRRASVAQRYFRDLAHP